MAIDSILSLPLEIMVAILTELDYSDILVCSRVCRYLNTVMKDSLELQYKIELGFDQLIDIPSSRSLFTTADRLQLLRERRKAWRDLTWSKHRMIKMSGLCDAYELVGGIFAKTERRGTRAPRHFTASILPSRTQPIEHRFEHKDLGVATKDFAIDPSQNLLALLEFHDFGPFWGGSSTSADGDMRIHMRTLLTNERHPEAKQPFLYHRGISNSPTANATLQIIDDIVGVFTMSPTPTVLIWSWRSGEKLVECRSLPYAQDVAFISPRAFCISTIQRGGEMHLFKFSDTPLSKITDASPSYISEAHRGLEHVATLRLPPLAHDARLDHLSTHTGPFVAHPGRFLSPPESEYEWEPFYTAPESRVHVLTADVAHQSFAALYRLVIHNRIFEKILEEDRQGIYRKTEIWNWEEWGPEHTRLFVAVESYRWLRYVHGSRVVFPLRRSPPSSSRRMLKVLDFNVHLPADPKTSAPPPNEAAHARYQDAPATLAPYIAPVSLEALEDDSPPSSPLTYLLGLPVFPGGPPIGLASQGFATASSVPISSTAHPPNSTPHPPHDTSHPPSSSAPSTLLSPPDPPSATFGSSHMFRHAKAPGRLVMDSDPVKDEIFAGPVVSKLPYWVSAELWDSHEHAGFMVDDRRLIGMEVDPSWDENIGDLSLLCF